MKRSLHHVRLRRCLTADADHRKKRRWYAHTLHVHNTICLSRAFDRLPASHQIGILLHEIGHVYGGERQKDADAWVQRALGIKIRYVNTVEWVSLEDLTDAIEKKRRKP